MRQPIIETASESDFEELWALERVSFAPDRRFSRRSLRYCLRSGRQLVRVVRPVAGGPVLAYTILMLHPRTLRIYSVAVAPEQQGRGLGRALIQDAVDLALQAGRQRISLEVDALDDELVAWYERQGFATVQRLKDYYGTGRPGLRMRRQLARTGPDT